MEINKIFDNILDLPGIEGACLFNSEGRMYINRLPTFMVNDLLVDAQRRIIAMYETMDTNYMTSDDYTINFREHWLLIRRFDKHVLLVLGGEKASQSSARMVTLMTFKHLTRDVLEKLEEKSISSETTSSKTSDEGKKPASAGNATVLETVLINSKTEGGNKPVRMYRGKPY